MSRPTTRTPVAIFNSNAEFIDALREALDLKGFPTATALLAEIQDGTLDLVAFLETHDPRVIVYDLPRPFERHWNFLRLLKQTDALRKRTWILTTTDKKALDAAVGGARGSRPRRDSQHRSVAPCHAGGSPARRWRYNRVSFLASPKCPELAPLLPLSVTRWARRRLPARALESREPDGQEAL